MLIMLAGCSPSGPPTPREWSLLAPEHRARWSATAIANNAGFEWKNEAITLQEGTPMTGVRFDGWAELKLPVTRYEIHFEAMRETGGDFFAALTFPVRSLDTPITFVLGGWGGALCGLSNIDDLDASDNSTRSEQRFTNGQWYRTRIAITDDDVQVWLDDRLIVNTSIRGRKLSMRPGDVEACAPFGIATYATTGRVRSIIVKRLETSSREQAAQRQL